MYYIDTNIIIRAFTNDDPIKGRKAQLFLEELEDGKKQATTTSLVISEVIYVLTGKYYKQDKFSVCEALFDLVTMPSLKIEDKQRLKECLVVYKNTKGLDFVDAYNIAYLRENDTYILLSFDSDFDGFSDILREEI